MVHSTLCWSNTLANTDVARESLFTQPPLLEPACSDLVLLVSRYGR